jgi:DNA-binding transcriptional LysR family regulator
MKNQLADLAAFATVAEERSFTRAAARLGVSTSALSHRMTNLEKRIGLQLLARTTRSVSPTAAGSAILSEVAPSLERIERTLTEATHLRDRPVGRLRLVLSRPAVHMTLIPKLAQFANQYPGIALEVTVSNDPVDIIEGQFDAGIQIGEYIQHGMIAVRVSDDLRLITVGAPAYFERNPIPRSPLDLKDHPCIAFRFSSGVYRWEFQKGRKQVTVNPHGPVSLNDPDLVLETVLAGVGIGLLIEEPIRGLIRKSQLIQVLDEWCPSFPGFFLYYPSRRNRPAALSALIDVLRIR